MVQGLRSPVSLDSAKLSHDKLSGVICDDVVDAIRRHGDSRDNNSRDNNSRDNNSRADLSPPTSGEFDGESGAGDEKLRRLLGTGGFYEY